MLQQGLAAYRLDGDNIRFGLNNDLGFGPDARTENIRRIAEVAKLFADSGTVAITSFISPYRADRDKARSLHAAKAGADEEPLPFVEVWVDVPVQVAEQRDPKGLYAKARKGEIKEFTGISAPYEEPEQAQLRLHSDKESVEESVQRILVYLIQEGLLDPAHGAAAAGAEAAPKA